MYFVRHGQTCFIGKRFRDVGELWNPTEIQEYDNLVFFDNEGLEDFISRVKKTDPVVFVSLVGCGTIEQLQRLSEMLSDGIKLEEITVSVDMVYKLLDYPNLWLGSEMWKATENCSGRLEPLDFADVNGRTCAFNVFSATKLLAKANEIIDWIESWKPVNNLEKVLLLDIWFQRTIQYIKDKESIAGGETYVCEDMVRSSLTEDVLLNHYGVCSDIAFSAALILNNPKVNIHCRQVSANCHSWNIIRIEDKEYYMDFTHNITRNPYRLSDALMTAGYCSNNTLLGKKDAMKKYEGPFDYPGDHLSDKSYDRKTIQKCLGDFKRKGIELTWIPQLVKNQCKKRA
ncbi:transglutaminase-like domain-containing protein [Aristaeella hokkaidonensis]|uniref:Uncharacterized protein n=1 Tax=Aristaeella hokkaidonensis TaxID=3046382 RepID=A0AC61MV57_9FIRM|nr:transglutaminase-like domain-containing protein [Aristaeella hokkaidonensis]QUC66354.1 hypothetical protein JYE49_10850 [Aristaeella hokkaidonensis]SNT94235.1 hypothetical protein SAMN06297421_104208 [Aristaeella hokkaidonensis]